MVSTDQIIRALGSPTIYPHKVEQVQTIITAVSAVFLTGEFAYKINKPLNLGFLDFSTLEKRKEQCEKEIKHNSLISPQLYLGTVTINNQEGNLKVNGSGEVIEYATKMRQVDSQATLNVLLQNKKVSQKHIADIAKKIFAFHQVAPSNPQINQFGSFETIKFNWDENFEQTQKYRNNIISNNDFAFIQQKINSFLEQNTELIQSRIAKQKIKHCHGDFHSENVFVINNEPIIFDSIVFNQRFPCSDVIAEIAFMAMDLDFHHRQDLADHFMAEYQNLSNDSDIPRLLTFYKCYRAYIRAKIACFTSEDTTLSAAKKQETIHKAKQYFALSTQYAQLL